MKLVEDFPFMRDRAHNFPPALWDELHACLKEAASRDDKTSMTELLALLADSGLVVQENEQGITVGSSDVPGGVGAGKSLSEALASFALLLVDLVHAQEATIHEREAQLVAYVPAATAKAVDV